MPEFDLSNNALLIDDDDDGDEDSDDVVGGNGGDMIGEPGVVVDGVFVCEEIQQRFRCLQNRRYRFELP